MSLSRARRSGITAATSPTKSRSLQTTSGLPGPVQNLSASANGSFGVTLSWSPPAIIGDSNITSYSVVGSGSASVSGTTATITGLSPSTAYSFDVVPVSSIGSGARRSSPQVSTPGLNAATGGTTADVTNYNGSGETWRVHTFSSNGTLSVTSATNPFRVLAMGGGGGGGGTNGPGGGGGQGGRSYVNNSQTLAATNYSITIGGGGFGGGIHGCAGWGGGGGGSSSITGIGTGNGGGGGAYGGSHGACDGGGPYCCCDYASAPTNSNITGSSVNYGNNGCSNCGGPGGGATNGGGGINSNNFACAGAGGAGRVFVSYRIA